jgi:uncharacterized protein YndB with AHSA1/START domain
MTTSGTSAVNVPVVRAVTVRRTPEDTFRLFTVDIGAWWPMGTHSVFGATARVDVEGSEVVETSAEGERSVWAEIVESSPPRRLVLSWHPGTDPAKPTRVEVSFAPDGEGATRVELTHTGWEALGERAEAARQSYDEGWQSVLGLFAEAG